MALIDRLRLSKDLALTGLPGLDSRMTDAAAIQGIVQVDLAFDIAARAALESLNRGIALEEFPKLLDAVTELGSHRQAIADLHSLRNKAQHGGLAPPAAVRQQLRLDGVRGLEIVFAMAGHDFHQFSSVPQITSVHFREPLEEALRVAGAEPANAIALVMVVFRRLRGWAEQILGEAAIPDAMGLHVHERWNDTFGMVRCADDRDQVVDAMLRVAATAVLKIDLPSWTRLCVLGAGRRARWDTSSWQYEHAADAREVTETDALWTIETVARAALSLELEWPGFILIPDEQAASEDSKGQTG